MKKRIVTSIIGILTVMSIAIVLWNNRNTSLTDDKNELSRNENLQENNQIVEDMDESEKLPSGEETVEDEKQPNDESGDDMVKNEKQPSDVGGENEDSNASLDQGETAGTVIEEGISLPPDEWE